MAEIKTILEENDFSLVVEYSGNSTNTPGRAKLEDFVYEYLGQSTPDRTVRFIVHTANDKWFLIFYIKQSDKFLYEKLTAK